MNSIITQTMTLQVLTNSSAGSGVQPKLQQMLMATDGLIFLLTGNVSKGSKSGNDFLAILEWAAGGPNRELEIIVGVFDKAGVWQTAKVIQTLSSLILAAKTLYLQKNLGGGLAIPIRFHGVYRWHAKALGLTAVKTGFNKSQKIIFGSTNFSDSALYGGNFELDIYADKLTDEGASLLSAVTRELGKLIRFGIKNHSVPNFHADLMSSLAGHVQITPKGMKW